MVYYIIGILILALDQWTKYLVIKNMDIGQSIPVIQDIFYLTSARNTGAAWSILEGQMWFFYIITVIVLGVVVYYMQKLGRYNPLLGIALGLVLGGATGNFIDRIFRGAVVDFFHVYIGSYSYPIFNIADAALVIGAVLICFYTLKDAKEEKSHDQTSDRSNGSSGDNGLEDR